MSRYNARMVELLIAAENCRTEEERARILAEVAAMQSAVTVRDSHTVISVDAR